MFENGLLNLTNWAGNVIMPTLAGLFFAAAIYRFSKAHPYSHLSWAGFAALMCSGLLRALEGFAQQAGANEPAVDIGHPGFDELAKLELLAALADLDRAQLAGPVVHVLEQVAMDGAKMGQVE